MKTLRDRLVGAARLAVLVAAASLMTVAAPAMAQRTLDGEQAPWFRESPDASKYFFIITGAAASDEIRDRYHRWSINLADTLATEYGYAEDHIILLLDDGSSEMRTSHIDGSSRREDIERQINALQNRVKQGDQVTFFLIGHGSSTGSESKFNIVGPDITGAEFAEWLGGFAQQDIVVVNTTSASYEFSRELSTRGRVVISATRSRAERFDPMFAGFFIEALQERKGDRDKNNRVSMLEAFNYARNSVEAWYREQGRLATEHAVLDDSGDGMFSMEPAPTMADGQLAEIAYIDVRAAGEEKQSPQARELLAEIQDLERSVFILRGQKSNYLEDDYWRRLEVLLVDLARKTGRYDELP
jgi:hypothetical protein